ncbi:MAG: hypothetical protein F4Y39_07525 [Gemmatimonadetes bacterium]|nr:hypothetical protein [Gemmatimonadota bacterium]MYG05445.1 hypothetical protein [Candidatus Poribacteria bacterium]MYK53518.1 hypothetical protein [Gemmatimonadota bacterium]
MQQIELQLEHAFNSAALIQDTHAILNSVTEGQTEWTQAVSSLINRIDDILTNTPESHVPIEWHIMIAGLHTLVSQVVCVTIAQGGEGDLVAERTRCDVLVSELCRLVSTDSLALPKSTDSIRQSLLQTGQCNSDELRAFLLMIPLPTLYWNASEAEFPYRVADRESDTTPSPMLRVIVFLDHAPVASPQFLKSNILYPLVFQVRGLTWPSDAVRLHLDLLTTCPQNEFSVSDFTLDKPHCIKDGEYQGELVGQIKFNSGQSSVLDDLIFTVRSAFETSTGDFTEIPVIGHNELRLRVVNEDLHPLMTGNRQLDQHIAELVTKLLSDHPKVKDELPDLLKMLQALARLLATYAQEAIYKGESDVPESEFQKTVLRDLRNQLGQVQEHPSQAGGVTDIRYRGVIVELKVERENGDREYISNKYTAQATQYAGVETRQISILLVLDLTTKEKPPGDIRNDIILTDVETHGGDDRAKEFPSKTFVFVINGNMKSPSTYSR